MPTLNLIKNDSYLVPFEKTITYRYSNTILKLNEFVLKNGSLKDSINGHLYFGLHKHDNSWAIREWAPNATSMYLIGDFSDWKPKDEFKFEKIGNGNWECTIPLNMLKHEMLYKLLISWGDGSHERIPAYCRRVVQDEQTKIFSAQVWDAPKKYSWKHKQPSKVNNPLIYEAHIGMATSEHKVGSYVEFQKNVLPRIAALGYNTIQLMAIQEHPYYGSFGYQVSNFFAPSSRFGTPEELKELIDEAHGLGISVILDIVHSHAVKNEIEGLAKFDGTDYQYFHEGTKGDHPVWDSRCFNYGKDEVINFLLSNCKYWLEEFRFDGFRFDGVTSMIYTHHGLGMDFINYNMYFNGEQDEDALTYLALANILTHEINPNANNIAEDVSGMPGIASPFKDGGIGFDFRMSMGVADYWIKVIKEKKDEDWQIGDIYYQLTNKRADERTISYAESHDQAMVGDKTIIFRLIDKHMYTSMQAVDENIVVDRGIALHKMIRLVSLTTAGDGYLNFMGNEFGHPEWIDFPREGNDWSYKYARRQWNLSDNKELRYYLLNEFDKEMIKLVSDEKILASKPTAILQNKSDQVLIFERGSLIFIFNFNPNTSFTDYGFGVKSGEYKIVLNSDNNKFGGFNRNDDEINPLTQPENNTNMLKLYLPSRSAIALKKIKF
ncbi:MAG: alpha amylase C-terminal domain-containing protein [Bacteroidetes bacterium]|nr:alpha amylase C-terminal domain-containing protein [Bacteroidota bacterium]